MAAPPTRQRSFFSPGGNSGEDFGFVKSSSPKNAFSNNGSSAASSPKNTFSNNGSSDIQTLVKDTLTKIGQYFVQNSPTLALFVSKLTTLKESFGSEITSIIDDLGNQTEADYQMMKTGANSPRRRKTRRASRKTQKHRSRRH
jgi:hypothetical protein